MMAQEIVIKLDIIRLWSGIKPCKQKAWGVQRMGRGSLKEVLRASLKRRQLQLNAEEHSDGGGREDGF